MRNAIFTLLSFLTFACGLLRAQDGALALQAATDRTIYVSGIPIVYVEAKILPQAQSPQSATSVRNIALVLDRSGSMAGEPVQALRQAVTAALGTLAERDVVSIVLFGSEVETVLEARRRDQIGDLDTLLARIEPAGGSALYDALNQGAAQLRRYAASATINHLVLVTDGPATKGPRERDDFMRLAELFAREASGFHDGLCEEFERICSRTSHARQRPVHFAAKPGELAGVLQTNSASAQRSRADVVSIEFHQAPRRSDGPGMGEIDDRTVTYRFPRVFCGAGLGVLAGARSSHVATRAGCDRPCAGMMSRPASPTLSSGASPSTSWRQLAPRKSINRDVIHSAVDAISAKGSEFDRQLDKATSAARCAS
jgi:hypothetical protein